MQYKLYGANTSIEVFTKMTIIMKLIAVACFFETLCCSICKYLLATGSKDKGILGHISTYFSTIEINS